MTYCFKRAGKMDESVNDAESPTPELEKLRLEIADLKWKVGKTYKSAQMVSIFSAIIAVLALLVGLYQFNHQQQREIQKPIREKQLALEFELSNVVAKLATHKIDDVERKQAETRFHELLWGPIVYIEDEELQALMTALTKCLDEYAQAQAFGDDTYTETDPGGCTSPEQHERKLKELSLNLTAMRRNKLGEEWNIAVADIHKARAEHVPSPQALP
jgi:hypothetical protein